MTDIVLIVAPKINTQSPTSGVGVLKSCVEQHGFSSVILDWNIKLYHYLNDKGYPEYFDPGKKGFIDQEIYQLDEDVWSSYWKKLVNQDEDQYKGFTYLSNLCEDFYQDCILELKSLNPEWVGISLLAFNSSISITMKFCEHIRKYLPDTKIVIGGGGVTGWAGQLLKDNNYIDHYVFGDAEEILPALLKGDTSNIKIGLDSKIPNQLHDLSKMPLPDFDDIDWNQYSPFIDNNFFKKRQANVTASRGCVRDCDFCNINTLWPEFRFRTADAVFDEIVLLNERYGVELISFNDSLLNGSMKQFRALLYKLANDPRAKDIWWWSQAIFRSERQMSESDWQLVSKSKCYLYEVGMEHFSAPVRSEMGKGFDDEAMWFSLNMLKKYKIPTHCNLIVGYPTETEEDHQIQLDNARKVIHEGYCDIIPEIGLPNLSLWVVPIFRMYQSEKCYKKFKDQLEYYKSPQDWKYKDNDILVRKRRQYELLHVIVTEYEARGIPPAEYMKVRLARRQIEKDMGLF